MTPYRTVEVRRRQGITTVVGELARPVAARKPSRRDKPLPAALMLARGHVARDALDGGAPASEVAARFGWTASRLSQALVLADGLAPDIQAAVLAMTSRDDLGERHLRPIAHLLDWHAQRSAFVALTSRR